MSYTNMFALTEPKDKPNLFGETKNVSQLSSLISLWCTKTGATVSPSRIEFYINGIDIQKFKVTDVSALGLHQLSESVLLNRVTEDLSVEFGAINKKLEHPKAWIKTAVENFGKSMSPKPKFSLVRLLGNEVADVVDSDILLSGLRDSIVTIKKCETYQIEPFRRNLAKNAGLANIVASKLLEVSTALNYLKDSTPDALVRDALNKRDQMLLKTLVLIKLCTKQMDDMLKLCNDVTNMVNEIEMTVLPLIESIIRSVLIGGVAKEQDISDIFSSINGALK